MNENDLENKTSKPSFVTSKLLKLSVLLMTKLDSSLVIHWMDRAWEVSKSQNSEDELGQAAGYNLIPGQKLCGLASVAVVKLI
jgi:hypothetical protein